jgi:hypothetical protein
MKDSKALYGFWDGEDCSGIVWETELGKIVTFQGNINPQMNLSIRDLNSEEVTDVDLRNVLMSILPLK